MLKMSSTPVFQPVVAVGEMMTMSCVMVVMRLFSCFVLDKDSRCCRRSSSSSRGSGGGSGSVMMTIHHPTPHPNISSFSSIELMYGI